MVLTNSIEVYWNNLEFSPDDLDYLYNYLLDREEPLNIFDLARALIGERIRVQQEVLNTSNQSSKPYLPSEIYNINDLITFPKEKGAIGKVIDIRDGISLTNEKFQVMVVEFSPDRIKEYVMDNESHPLNLAASFAADQDELKFAIFNKYGNAIAQKINQAMEISEEIVCIGGKSFPKALLVDINAGFLNLAEALLEMSEGGPLSTQEIINNIEFPSDDNPSLIEFSMNYVLQEDPRFDEVGPAGETLWYLRSFEPEYVQNVPVYLKSNRFEYEKSEICDELNVLQKSIFDELEFEDVSQENPDEVTIHLIFPHWRAGTLPLSSRLSSFFPVAFESNNVLFTFVDEDSKERFPGWVIFKPRYVYGLGAYYKKKKLIPGSVIHLKKSGIPGEIIISLDSSRSTRDWIRTANVNADKNLTFTMLKQMVSSEIDERMAIALPESLQLIDEFWGNTHKIKQNFEKFIISMMRELSKLNPQGHVHVAELYAAVNIGFRCPPGPILNLLHQAPWAISLGDLYYRLDVNT
jgi:hypothetical protein